jgi:hypothetical protein
MFAVFASIGIPRRSRRYAPIFVAIKMLTVLSMNSHNMHVASRDNQRLVRLHQ